MKCGYRKNIIIYEIIIYMLNFDVKDIMYDISNLDLKFLYVVMYLFVLGLIICFWKGYICKFNVFIEN